MRRPGEILNTLASNRQALADRTLETIADRLERDFTGSPVDVWLYTDIKMTEAVFPHVRDQLAKDGWTAKITQRMQDQRDGDGIRVTVSAAEKVTGRG